MTFNNAQNVNVPHGIFNEIYPGGTQNIITNNVNFGEDRQHAASARFDSKHRESCLEGTREEILADIDQWIARPASDTEIHHIYWLNGLAGTGKTTIAYTIAEKCKTRAILGASFFCSRDDVDTSNPRLVFTTIANQLGQFYPPFRELVTRAYNADPGLRYSYVPTQLEKLLVEPLREVREDFPGCVIVLDALDECKDDNATSIILTSLSRHISSLEPLKFLVTSRPEQRIFGAFQRTALNRVTRPLDLHEVKLDVIERDIEHFLTTSFNDVKQDWDLDPKWPELADIQALTRQSNGLFIFAATAIKFIRDPNYSDPKHQLTRLLQTTVIDFMSPQDHLDRLYMRVLTEAFPRPSADLVNRLKSVLGTITLLRYPLCIDDIGQLLHMRPDAARTTIMRLGSVLVLPAKDDNEPIRFLHPSFFDFLTNSARCTDPHFMVNSDVQQASLAKACLEAMKDLKRDICEIQDSSKLNSEVEDLSERIALFIPPCLQYSCRHWTYHLSCCQESDTLLELLRYFCSNSLLHWVEVCSLLGELRSALIGLDELLAKTPASTFDGVKLLNDCKRFIREFFPVLSLASAHTYYSALPFTPTGTALRKQYRHELRHSVVVHSGIPGDWDPCLCIIECHRGAVNSIVVSPDGVYIAGLSSAGLCFWDFLTGTHIQCFTPDYGIVKSFAFSPINTHIVLSSGADIQFWDIPSGVRLSTLKGHIDHVVSIAFSPDGSRIASGSVDETVRIWDVLVGNETRRLEGHSSISAITYSPAGTQIAFVSDMKLRIWDDSIGNYIMSCNTDHWSNPSVHAIAYSPCGNEIVSIHNTQLAYVRDTATGAILRSLQRDSAHAFTVAYSPDGSQVASGSYTGRLQICNVSTGEEFKLNGHSNNVEVIAYSFRGTQIVSGSADGTIRIWDAEPRQNKSTYLPSYDTHPSISKDHFMLASKLSSHFSIVILCPSRIATSSYPVGRYKTRLPYHRASHSVVELWDTSGTRVSRLEGLTVVKMFFRSDDTLLIIATIDAIHIYSARDGAHLRSLNMEWEQVISSDVSPDGAYIAFTSKVDPVLIRVCNLNDVHSRINRLEGHSGAVNHFIFSPDGVYIISLSDADGTIQIWSTATGSRISCFPHNSGYWDTSVKDIHISSDRKSIMVTRYNRNLVDSFPIQRELWPTGGLGNELLLFDPSMIKVDGWLYHEESRRRICWVPVRSRATDVVHRGSGCFLGINRKETTALFISQS